MAENADGTEKSEEPTEKKIREAREKGQIPRSRELTSLAMTLGAAIFLMFYGGQMMQDFSKIGIDGLSFDRVHAFDEKMLWNRVLGMVVDAIFLTLPFLFLMILIAITAPALLGGWNFSSQAMAPKLSKLNPISGIKRMFSLNALMELLKAFGKFALVSAVAIYFLYVSYYEVLGLGTEPLKLALAHAGEIIVEAFIFVSLSLIVIAAIDVPFQVHQHTEQLKMTKQEVKEEFKNTEGNPEIKGRIRQMQRQMSQQRMMQSVPEADVVVTNPTHYAVALKYDPESMAEPVVLALGVDFIAAQIRTLAKEHDVPLVEAPPLARALYYNAEIDQPIPYELFRSVALVLSYVYQLKEGKSVKATDFSDIAIPEGMKTEA